MKKRIQAEWKKLYIGKNFGWFLAGIFCLFLVLRTVMPVNAETATGATGIISLNNVSTGTESFWNGRKIPPQADFWQDLNVETTVTLTSGGVPVKEMKSAGYTPFEQGYTDNVTKISFLGLDAEKTADYTFSLENLTADVKAKSSSFLDGVERAITSSDTSAWTNNPWIDNTGQQQYYSSLRYYPWSDYTKTYYRVITDSNAQEVNLGKKLLEHYQEDNNITWTGDKGTFSSGECYWDAMVFSGDQSKSPTASTILDTFIAQEGMTEYSIGSEIPLQAGSGQRVVRIEMLTVQRVDYYGSGVEIDFVIYTAHSYEFSYTEKAALPSPRISTESKSSVGTDNTLVVSKDETIFLENTETAQADNTVLQYYFSNRELSDTSNINWNVYNTSGIPAAGLRYLYVRCAPTNTIAETHRSSAVTGISLDYRETSTASVTANPASGGSVDVGQSFTLSANGTILYTMSGKAPTFTKVSAAERGELDQAGMQSGSVLLKMGDKVYLKLNGLWYLCSDAAIQQYSESNKPKTEESLRTNGYQNIYVQVVEEGKELGYYQQLRYSYGLSGQTEKPKADPATGSTVTMLQKIQLTVPEGSKVFYTLNGSVPSINVVDKQPVPGTGTYLYDKDKGIVVSESFASYGKNFTIMAQAVTYNEEGLQTKKDSSVARFTYKTAAENVLVPVTSMPATNANEPTHVKVGDVIQLHSESAGVTIFYTLDGSEPYFDLETGECLSENTIKYDANKGVVVGTTQNNTQLIITAVACKIGQATSEITRMVYQYPQTVSAPYATPGSGTVLEGTEVSLKTSMGKALIYYEVAYGTEEPKDPTSSSQVFDPENPIKIMKNMRIKAVAELEGMYSSVVSFSYTVSDKLSMPEASIVTGMMVPTGTVITLSAGSGATIHYTLDGSDPKDEANKNVLVGNNVIISGETGAVIVLRAYASKEGFSSSETANYSYSISAYEGGIYADRESGSVVKNGDVIMLNTDMSDAEIYYTTDGTTPTESSQRGRTVTVQGQPGENITIMAMAVASGTKKSNSYAIFTYTIIDKLSAPTSSVPDGVTFTKAGTVTLTAEAGRIYYTIDGTDPTTASMLYQNSIEVDKEMEIRAIAVADEFEQSDVSIFTYGFASQVAAPIASYASGELDIGTKISFTCETEGAVIYYRTDGKEPDLTRKSELEVYTEPITVNQATTFKVIAVKDKMQDSKVLTVGYTVREPIVVENTQEEVQQEQENQSNRLQSRRSFSDTESGPSYTDVVLRNAGYGAIVAAQEGALPDNVQLIVERTNVTDATERRVKQVVNDSYGVVASYDVKLLVNGEETQPNGTIEIGLPIPVEYENSMLYIVHVQEDGNIELFETRRSGGIAYAKVEHLSVYSITAPVEYEEEEAALSWLPIIYILAVAVAGFGIWLIYKSRKDKREEKTQNV